MSKASMVVCAFLAVLAVAPHAGAAKPSQRIVVRAGNSKLTAAGLASLRPGFVRIEVRNVGRGSHGVELVQLRRPLSAAGLVQAFAAESRALVSLGGIQQVVPGRPWQMTAKLTPGSYALVDFGQNGPKANYARGLLMRFRVAKGKPIGAAPAPVGEIGMHDFRFAFDLPRRFSGRGVVEIPNLGRTSHEITLVRIDRRHSPQQVLNLILAGAQAPPPWATVVELVSLLSPGRTAYVRVDLPRGRYVALCLTNTPGSQRLHAQHGMIGTFEVV